MRRAFTLVEVLIVLAIIGILAAIIIPEFQDHAQKARETTAKDNLRILRTTIERYAAEHNGVPPGYTNNDPLQGLADYPTFRAQLLGPDGYLSEFPENPFNGNNYISLVADGAAIPEGLGAGGYYYKPQTREVVIDHLGTDSEGVPYREY